MVRKIIGEPLVHFLVAGFFLFIYFKTCSTESGLENTLIVSKEEMLDFMQFQSKAFNEDVYAAKLDELTEKERTQMVQNYVQDEVLYREALKLGLDQNDFVLKRRIIQKMEFILDDFEGENATIEADSLELFFEQNKERYFQAAQFSFNHIFFKNNRQENALNRANHFMQNKAHQKLSASESLKYGDRFLYHRNYAEKTSSFLESQFGTAFTEALSQLQQNDAAWQGPIPSTHGQHWVQLSHKQEAKIPLLKDIKNVVKVDYLNHLKNQHKQKQIQTLVDNYKVQVNWD